MKKILKSRKALSPVVAAIILIAVTVAVSIAVAAWMGALTFTFMKTESLEWPTSVSFLPVDGSNQPNNTITLTVSNTGSSDLYLSVCKVNGAVMPDWNGTSAAVKIATGASVVLHIQNVQWRACYTYEIRFVATSGTEFAKTFTAS